MEERTVWAVVIASLALVLSSAIIGGYWYNHAKTTAAIAAGLCETTVPGNRGIVWVTCPKAVE